MAKATKEQREKAKEKREKAKEKRERIEHPPGDSQNTVVENPQSTVDETTVRPDMEWRCLVCHATAPPSGSGYMKLVRHPCTGDKQIRLVVIETGEELASNWKEAQAAGLLSKPKDEESPGKELDSSRGGLQVTGDNNIRISITLPAIDLARFNIAKAPRPGGVPALEPDASKSFDEFVHDCINARFEKDWKMVLILAPMKALKEEKEKDDGKTS